MHVLQQQPHNGGLFFLGCIAIDGHMRLDDKETILHVLGLPLGGVIDGLPDAKLAVADLRKGLHDGAICRDRVG